MSEIGQITVKIGADTYELQKGLADAKTQVQGFGKSTGALEGVLSALGTVAIATAGAIAVITKNAIDSADNLNKMSQKVGIATEDLSKLAYAARLSDVDIGSLQQSLVFLSRGMSEASQGSGNALQAFNALGISFKNNDGTLRSQAEVLADVADKFANLRDGTEKTALAVAIFGRAGANMIPMLNQGSAGLSEMGDELANFGGVISGQTARSAEQFNDNLTRLQTILSGLSMQAFAPLIEGLNASFDAFLKTDKALRSFMQFWGTFSLSGKDIGDPTMALAKTEEAIQKVKRSIEALNKYPVLNKDDILIATKQLEYLEGRSKAIQSVLMLNKPAIDQTGLATAPTMEDPKKAEEERKKLEDLRIQQAEKLAILAESFMTETQLEQLKFEQQQTQLQLALENRMISEEQYRMWLEQLENEHGTRMNDIRKKNMTDLEKFNAMSWQKQATTVAGQLMNMTASVANSSKEMFAINKAASLVNAVISTYEGINKTLASYPYPLSVAMAAAQAAAGFANVRAIASQQFSGKGTTAPSVAASTPAGAVPVANVNNGVSGANSSGAGQTVNINLQGNTFNRDQVRDLITQINEVISDGSTLRLQ